jgi:hypothetical protein
MVSTVSLRMVKVAAGAAALAWSRIKIVDKNKR